MSGAAEHQDLGGDQSAVAVEQLVRTMTANAGADTATRDRRVKGPPTSRASSPPDPADVAARDTGAFSPAAPAT